MQKILYWFLLWLGVTTFWLTVTRSSHPTFTLAIIVTLSLMIAYGIAILIDQLVLIPTFWNIRRYFVYAVSLSSIMLLFTALALSVIRISYSTLFGPDPDPYGAYKHYAIDLFGMAVHLAGARCLIAIVKTRAPARARNDGAKERDGA